jgi:hypothetical protein
MVSRCLSVLLLCALAVLCAAQGPESWKAPALPAPDPQLPRLAAPLVVDGVLAEWDGAAVMPLRAAGDIIWSHAPHTWDGPVDASLALRLAWTPAGLAIGAEVFDDDICNDRTAEKSHEQDGIELFLDGRADGVRNVRWKDMTGAYQLCVRAPMPTAPATAYAQGQPDGKIAGLQIAAKRTKTGYVAELLVPWSAFPGFAAKPGVRFGVQVALDDYDRADGAAVHPFAMTYHGLPMWQAFWTEVTWRLVDAPVVDGNTVLEPAMRLDMPGVVADRAPVTVAVELCGGPAANTARFRLRLLDAAGAVRQERILRARPEPAPWNQVRRTSFAWMLPPVPDGYYTIQAAALARDGQALGQVSGAVLVTRTTMQGLLDRLGRFDVPKLAKADPFRAAAVCGAAAAIERVKRSLELRDLNGMGNNLREAAARLDVLETGKTADAGVCAALNLAADPQAQVAVEFPEENMAQVAFNWGAVPLAFARIVVAKDPKTALDPDPGYLFNGTVERVTVNGLPGTRPTVRFNYRSVALKDADPSGQVVALQTKWRAAYLLPMSRLAWLSVDAVAFAPTCPDAVRAAVTAVVKAPVVTLDEAIKKPRALIAGDVRALPGNPLKDYWVEAVDTQARPTTVLTVLANDRTITAYAATRPLAEQLVTWLAAGAPITPAQSDALRAAMLAQVPHTPAPLPAGCQLFAGDVHSHTFYSDGNSSPVGNLCEAVYAGLDYLVMSDHNTLDGARVARALLDTHRLAFPMVIGEEITTSWSHLNGYPLREFVDPGQPLAKITAAVHQQRGVIQWNHPGYPDSDFYKAQWPKRLAGSDLDAWEHLPALLDAWMADGTLPLLTGSTDTHSGTFDSPERTIIFAPAMTGEQLAEAIRRKRAAISDVNGAALIYGPADMVGAVWAALQDGAGMKAARAARITAALKDVDLMGLIRASQPRVVAPPKEAK